MPSIEYNEDQYNEFVYNSGTLVYLPSELQPEDARSVIADLYPTRVNWVANPGFQTAIDVSGQVGWKSLDFGRYDHTLQYNASQVYDLFSKTATTAAVRSAVNDPPYTNYAVKIAASSALRYADLTDLSYAIPVAPPEGDDKPFEQYQKNLWKFSFLCRKDVAEETSPPPTRPTDLHGGFLVLRTDGSYDFVITSVEPQPLPWDRSPVEDATVTTEPESATGWFCTYEVLDLGPDALWAIPVLINAGTAAAYFTAVIAERWDDVTLLSGNLFIDVGQESGEVGDGRPRTLPVWRYDWNRADLLALDPLVYFDGDSSLSTQDDFVWLSPSDLSHSVSGYYPQRRQRVNGLRSMMDAWLPVSRTASIRYALDTPRALRPL